MLKYYIMTEITNQDGYANAVMGTGTNRDRTSYNQIGSYGLINRGLAEHYYISDPLMSRVVDIYPDAMTQQGFYIKGIENDKDIQSMAQELDLLPKLADAVRWGRLYGGALVVYGVNDGGILEDELNENAIQGLDFVRVYDRHHVTAYDRYNDPMDKRYGEVKTWLVAPPNGEYYKVDASRVCVIDGKSCPDFVRSNNDNWGLSALQGVNEVIARLMMTYQHSEHIIERLQQAVHKIPDLAQTLQAPGGEDMIKKRVDVVDMVRGILNTVVIDGQEDYAIATTSSNGLHELIDRMAEAVCAVTGIPYTVLFGRTKGGMSNTGDGELKTWYAKVEAEQKRVLLKPLDKALGFMMPGVEEYELCFENVATLTELEEETIKETKARTNKLEMETFQGYEAMQALDADDIRNLVKDKYDLSE